MRFNRAARKGVLHVEDVSAVGPQRDAQTLDRIPFEVTSETEFAGGRYGGKLSLAVPADSLTLALRIVDVALDQDPWK